MSYAFFGLGETSGWLGLLAALDEVYLLRLQAKHLTPRSPLDLLTFVRAVGQYGSLQPKIDVRGVAIWGTESDRIVDIVFTSADSGVTIAPPTAGGMIEDIKKDPQVQSTFPGLVIADGELLELTGPADAIDHWRAQPILWDHRLSGPVRGGPTDTFANPAEYSIVLGKADDGRRAKPWVESKPGLDTGPLSEESAGSVAVLVLGIGALGALGWYLGKRKGKRR